MQKRPIWFPPSLWDLIHEDTPKWAVAGGAARSMVVCDVPRDIDLFYISSGTSSPKDLIRGVEQWLRRYTVAQCLADGRQVETYTVKFKCPRHELLSVVHDQTGMAVQFITKMSYPSVESLLRHFDFVCTMFGYSADNGLVHGREAYGDAMDKRVSINRVEYPVATMRRLQKYREYGYRTGEAMEEFVRRVIQFPDEVLDMALYTLD